jgi:hypothetical protein
MLSFGFLLRCLLALLLVPGFSAIGDLRQHGPDSLNISFAPEMDTHSAQADRFRRGNLPFGDVAGQGREWQSQFLSGLASRVAIHMEQVYHIDIALVKY